MDIAMQEEEQKLDGDAAKENIKGEAEFPGTEEAIKESLKSDEKAQAGTTTTAAPPPTVVVDESETKKDSAAPPRYDAASPAPSASSTPGTHTPRSTQIPLRPALTDKSHEDLQASAEADPEDPNQKKKAGLTKEQREQLAAYEKERARIRQERVDTLVRKLIDRLSVWTETDKSADVTRAFQEKTRLEVENLKMESFGIDILHAIGQTYVSKASTLLRSQKFLGIGGFFSKLRDKGNMVKETWNTITSAIDAQQTMEQMARMEEQGGEDWNDEKRAEYERRVTGKILTAAWRGSKFEIQGVLREVCDVVLNDKKVPLNKRLERAQALVLIGDIFNKVGDLLFFLMAPFLISRLLMFIQAARSPEEEGDYLIFEQLVAEAAIKKDKNEEKKRKKDKKDGYSAAAAASSNSASAAATSSV
jgi:hypothetical protein